MQDVMGMSKDEFYGLPAWKQTQLRKEAGLFWKQNHQRHFLFDWITTDDRTTCDMYSVFTATPFQQTASCSATNFDTSNSISVPWLVLELPWIHGPIVIHCFCVCLGGSNFFKKMHFRPVCISLVPVYAVLPAVNFAPHIWRFSCQQTLWLTIFFLYLPDLHQPLWKPSQTIAFDNGWLYLWRVDTDGWMRRRTHLTDADYHVHILFYSFALGHAQKTRSFYFDDMQLTTLSCSWFC